MDRRKQAVTDTKVALESTARTAQKRLRSFGDLEVAANLFGITKATKRIRKELGIIDARKLFRAWINAKRRFKGKIGYESEEGRLIRNGLPRPGRRSVVVIVLGMAVAMMAAALGSAW